MRGSEGVLRTAFGQFGVEPDGPHADYGLVASMAFWILQEPSDSSFDYIMSVRTRSSFLTVSDTGLRAAAHSFVPS